VRNEAGEDRYLRRVLARCLSWSDAVLVLDDTSTDATPDIAREMGCVVRTRSGELAWGKESSARAELWSFACEYATDPDDWVLIADADMVLHGDPRPLCESDETNAWAWVLYDCWDSEDWYREDGFWQGHHHPRVWLLAPNRVPEGWVADWSDRGIHVGHFPANFPLIAGIAPATVYWAHYSFLTATNRALKAAQYASVAHQLSPAERAHAASILDPQATP
jgi:glycosyltransferase involved in cell wall biosynthesis